MSELTIAEWAEDSIKQRAIDGIRAAVQVDPANPRLAARLGRRLADETMDKSKPEDYARRAQAEADFQTRRAAKLASDNDEVKKLRAEVVQLLNLPSLQEKQD
jgi:hypothetical protein